MDRDNSLLREEIDQMKTRLVEKQREISAFNHVREEFDSVIEKISIWIESTTTTKDLQIHRSLFDRLPSLSITLTSQLADSIERDRVRRRLQEITRRWTEVEEMLLNEEDHLSQMHQINEQSLELHSIGEHWLQQTRQLIDDLKNVKDLNKFDPLIVKGKTSLSIFATNFDQFQRVRNRFQRTTQSTEATEKVFLSSSSSTHPLTSSFSYANSIDGCNLSLKHVTFLKSNSSRVRRFIFNCNT
jgi:hypothetical protein